MPKKQLTDCLWCGLNPCQCNPALPKKPRKQESVTQPAESTVPAATTAAVAATWMSIPVQDVEVHSNTVSAPALVAYTTSTDLDEIFVAAPPLTFVPPTVEEQDLDMRLAVENLLPLLHPEERELAVALISPKQTSEMFRRGAEVRRRHGLA